MLAAEIQPKQTRPADRAEIERMSSPVLWMYERGQVVALWKSSGFISLVPDSIPVDQVIFLKKFPTQ
jgi:hypothetical protein